MNVKNNVEKIPIYLTIKNVYFCLVFELFKDYYIKASRYKMAQMNTDNKADRLVPKYFFSDSVSKIALLFKFLNYLNNFIMKFF